MIMNLRRDSFDLSKRIQRTIKKTWFCANKNVSRRVACLSDEIARQVGESEVETKREAQDPQSSDLLSDKKLQSDEWQRFSLDILSQRRISVPLLFVAFFFTS